MFNASVRPSVRPSVRLSVCLKPKFGQLFDVSCLNLRGSAERTCNKKTKFGPTFYVLYNLFQWFQNSETTSGASDGASGASRLKNQSASRWASGTASFIYTTIKKTRNFFKKKTTRHVSQRSAFNPEHSIFLKIPLNMKYITNYQ